VATIADQITELQRGMAGHLAADVAATFAAEQAGLDAAGVPGGVARPGTKLPDGDLLDAHGAPTTLAAARGGRPAVVVFYRGGWCPYCSLALRAYQADLVPALAERGAELIAVSPQAPDGSLSTQEANELTFTVLSDPGLSVAGQLGILFAPGDDTLAAQGQLGLDLTAVNADGSATLPMPTAVVVDADGVIRWIDVHPNYTTRTEPAAILAALDAAAG
jgi:peroxiredoxin